MDWIQKITTNIQLFWKHTDGLKTLNENKYSDFLKTYEWIEDRKWKQIFNFSENIRIDWLTKMKQIFTFLKTYGLIEDRQWKQILKLSENYGWIKDRPTTWVWIGIGIFIQHK